MERKTETIKYLTNREVQILYRQLAQDTSRHALRNQAIFLVTKYCALRASEVGLLKESDYDSVKKQIFCRRLKGSRSNTIRILDPEVISSLDAYLAVKDKIYPRSEFLFPSQKGKPISRKMLHYLYRRYCAGTEIARDKRHMHTLKHTRAIELGERQFDIKDIQWWLGHTNVENTLIYSQFTTQQQTVLYEKYLASKKRSEKISDGEDPADRPAGQE